MKEKDLFPRLKKHFKDKGYSVYAEVACYGRGVDFVAVKDEEHIAVEMKLRFNWEVIRQARGNVSSFGLSYVAYPTKKAVLLDPSADESYWKLPEKLRDKIDHCRQRGIGVLQLVGEHQIVFEAMEPRYQKPYKVFNFSHHIENEHDEAGLPSQKGVSEGYYELQAIKDYVRKNPNAKWADIFQNIYTHYSSAASLSSSMKSWRGFSLPEFKKTL